MNWDDTTWKSSLSSTAWHFKSQGLFGRSKGVVFAHHLLDPSTMVNTEDDTLCKNVTWIR
jgi:hypothetical protein